MSFLSIPLKKRRWPSGQNVTSQARTARRRNRSLAQRNGLLLEALEDRRLMTATINLNVAKALSYQGSSIANDLTVSVSGGITTFSDSSETISVTNSSTLTVTGNGTHTVTVSSGLASISIDTNNGDDVVNIQSIGVATSVNTGIGSDSINVGSLAPNGGGTLAGIQASLTLNDAGVGTATIDDSGDTTASTFAIHADSVTGLTSSPILIGSGISALNVHGGSGGNTITVDDTPANATVDLYSGTGDDNVSVLATSTALGIHGEDGSDNVDIGNAGSLAAILGAIHVDNDEDYTNVTVDGSAETAPATVELNYGLLTGLAPAAISMTTDDIGDLNIYGGSGGNTYTIYQDTVSDGAVYLYSGTGDDTVQVQSTVSDLYIDGVDGADTVTVGDPFDIASITGQVSVTNTAGSTDLTADAGTDSEANAATVTISGTQITDLAPAPIIYDNTLSSLRIIGPGGGANPTNYVITGTPDAPTSLLTGNNGHTINVQATTGALSITNQGLYEITVGNNGDISGIDGLITVSGFTPKITVDDSNSVIGRNLILSGTNTGAQLGSFLNYDPQELFQLVVLAGSGNDSLTVDFQGGNPMPIADQAPDSPDITVDGHLHYDGGGGNSNVLIFLGDPTAANNYKFTDEVYTPSDPGAGRITLSSTNGLDGSIVQNVDFVNLTPVEDSAVANNYTINLNAGSHQVQLSDTTVGPNSTPALLIAPYYIFSTSSFESAAVANKTHITINPTLLNSDGFPAENEFLIDNSIAPAGLDSLAINGGTTDDQYYVNSTAPGIDYILNSDIFNGNNSINGNGDGNDTFYINGSGLANASAVVLVGGTSYDTANITSSEANPTIQPYFLYGTFLITNLGTSSGVVFTTSVETINITKPVSPVTGTSVAISATEAQPFTNKVVGTFTVASADLGANASDFAATISWGDNTTSPGWIVANSDGTYSVLGNHTYATKGTFTATLSVTALGSTGTVNFAQFGTAMTMTSTGPDTNALTTVSSNVTVAASPLTAQFVQVSGIDGNPLSTIPTGVLVATFTDSGTIGLGTDYSANISWGDGTSSASTQIIAIGTPNGTVFSVYGNHTYADVGTYPVNVTITKTASGAQMIAASTASISDAPLFSVTPQPTVNATAGTFFNGTIGVFIDTDPTVISLAQASQAFKIMVDWGDGTPASVGYLTASSSISGGIVYTIAGRHTYASSLFNGLAGPGSSGPVNSTFPITIYVVDADGASINLSNTANVSGLSVVVTAHLDPSSDSGLSNTDGITNVTQPTFVGTTSQGNVRVAVYETPSAGGSRVLIGTTTSDSTGAWVLTSNVSLGDGGYTITAIGVDSFNQIISDTATVTPTPLVIDTVGPKVTGLYFNRVYGQIDVTYQDFGGVGNGGAGLNLSTIVDANNYRLVKANQTKAYLLSAVGVSPGTTSGAQSAALFINGGAYLRGGKYVFTIYSAGGTNPSGLKDIAGNALDGEYYGFLPSGNNVRGGNFVATLNAKHTVTYAPGSVIGSATPVTPPGTHPKNVHIKRVGPSATPHGLVATKLAARHSVHQSIKPKLHHS